MFYWFNIIKMTGTLTTNDDTFGWDVDKIDVLQV
jgi:hypothetical protein